MNNRTARFLLLVLFLTVLGLSAAGPAAASIPVLRFIDPNDGDVISGRVTVVVFSPAGLEETDPPQPQKEVRLSVSGAGEVVMTPQGDNLYAAKINTTKLANGKHTFTATEITGPVAANTWPVAAESVSVDVVVHNVFID